MAVAGNPDILHRNAERNQHDIGAGAIDRVDDPGLVGLGEKAVARAGDLQAGCQFASAVGRSFRHTILAAEEKDRPTELCGLLAQWREQIGSVEIGFEALVLQPGGKLHTGSVRQQVVSLAHGPAIGRIILVDVHAMGVEERGGALFLRRGEHSGYCFLLGSADNRKSEKRNCVESGHLPLHHACCCWEEDAARDCAVPYRGRRAGVSESIGGLRRGKAKRCFRIRRLSEG